MTTKVGSNMHPNENEDHSMFLLRFLAIIVLPLALEVPAIVWGAGLLGGCIILAAVTLRSIDKE